MEIAQSSRVTSCKNPSHHERFNSDLIRKTGTRPRWMAKDMQSNIFGCRCEYIGLNILANSYDDHDDVEKNKNNVLLKSFSNRVHHQL